MPPRRRLRTVVNRIQRARLLPRRRGQFLIAITSPTGRLSHVEVQEVVLLGGSSFFIAGESDNRRFSMSRPIIARSDLQETLHTAVARTVLKAYKYGEIGIDPDHYVPPQHR